MTDLRYFQVVFQLPRELPVSFRRVRCPEAARHERDPKWVGGWQTKLFLDRQKLPFVLKPNMNSGASMKILCLELQHPDTKINAV